MASRQKKPEDGWKENLAAKIQWEGGLIEFVEYCAGTPSTPDPKFNKLALAAHRACEALLEYTKEMGVL